jgi:hypothetical protein
MSLVNEILEYFLMLSSMKSICYVNLKGMYIYHQLLIEEVLLRHTQSNWYDKAINCQSSRRYASVMRIPIGIGLFTTII